MTIFWCNDPKGTGCSWSGEQDELVEAEGADDCEFTHCPHCGGTDFEEEEEDDDEPVEPEPSHDAYDVGGE